MIDNDKIDFGEDDGMTPQTDARFDAWITGVAPSLNEPGRAPRAEMWMAIQAARAVSRDAEAGRIPGVTPIRRRWPIISVIAAALLLGVAIDRLATRRSDVRVAAGPPVGRSDTNDASRLYRLAAAQTLTQAEALLVAYRASDVSTNDAVSARQLGTWGRQVLTSTRLLLDSPAGRDPQLRALLDDLELVLVQIVQLSGAPLDTTDRELIDRALQDSKLLPRIRTAMPAPMVDAASN